MTISRGRIMSATKTLLSAIGENVNRPGLAETPSRIANGWKTWASGYQFSEQAIKDLLTTFEDGAEDYDQFIVVKGIPVYSHCEHHLAPFFGTAAIGYIPRKRIVGLSKLSRLAEVYSRRLQVQERLTQQIATALETHLQPKAVGVFIECRHLCMESRGIQIQGSVTRTQALKGLAESDPAVKAEFLALVRN